MYELVYLGQPKANGKQLGQDMIIVGSDSHS